MVVFMLWVSPLTVPASYANGFCPYANRALPSARLAFPYASQPPPLPPKSPQKHLAFVAILVQRFITVLLGPCHHVRQAVRSGRASDGTAASAQPESEAKVTAVVH